MARFLAVLTALLVPWPGLGRAYVGAFSCVGSVLVAPLLEDPGVEISFHAWPESDEHHEWYSMVSVSNAQSHAPFHRGAVDLRRSGYLQVAILLALAASFPRLRSLRWALATAWAIALLVTLGWLPVLVYLAEKDVIHPGSMAFAALAIGERSLVGAPGMAFFVPGALWFFAVRIIDRHSCRRGAIIDPGATVTDR